MTHGLLKISDFGTLKWQRAAVAAARRSPSGAVGAVSGVLEA